MHLFQAGLPKTRKQLKIMKSNPQRTNNRAFSLTELLVAIVIIVILAAISVTVTLNLKRRANSAKAVASLRESLSEK